MTRLKSGILLLVGLSIAMLASYATAQSGPDVSGTWTGSTVSGASTITLVLQQAGNNVTGTLTGAGVDHDGPVTGTVQGNTIRLQNGRGSTPFLSVGGEQMSGTLSGGTAVTLRRTGK